MKRQFLSSYADKDGLKYVNRIYDGALKRLAAEYVVLKDTDNHSAAEIVKKLKENMPLLRECAITRADLTNEFIDQGEFRACDLRLASKALLESQTSFWFKAYPNEEIDVKTATDALEAFKQRFFDDYFSKLPETTPSEKGRAIAKNSGKPNLFDHVNEYEVLRNLICGTVESGDSVLYILCPLLDDPKIHYQIKTDMYHTHLQRLFERRGDDLIIINSDITSPDFIMAFMESLPFCEEKHKQEYIARLATLLLNEGKRV